MIYVIVAAIAASACATASAAVPSASTVHAALLESCPQIGGIDDVKCQSMAPNEPTEAVCSYTVSTGSKSVKDKTFFAVDSKGWHLIDTPAVCPRQK